MAITLTIGGTDRTNKFRRNTMRWTSELNSRDTLAFQLVSEDGTYRPSIGQTVTLTDGATTYFGGTIDSIDEQAFDESSSGLVYDVTCVDYSQIADRRLVVKLYENTAAGTIAINMVTNYLTGEGVTTTNVITGPTVVKALFNYVPVSQALGELCQVTGYSWYIDYNKDLHFFPRSQNVAPFSLTNTSVNFFGMRIRRHREQYRNKQYVRGGNDITSSRVENFKGDGQNRSFTLQYPVGLAPTVTVNAVSKTIGVRNAAGGGQPDTGKDFYYQKYDRTITQDPAGTVLTSSDTLAVTYQGFFPVIAEVPSEQEVADRKTIEGGSGIYENLEIDQAIEDDDTMLEKGYALLRKYGTIPVVINFQTDTAGLLAGQLITINLTAHSLNSTYLIRRVEAEDLDGTKMRWSVEALSGESLGGWVDFFQKLAEQGRKFVINENEVLLLMRSQFDNLICSDTFQTPTTGSAENRAGFALADFAEAG